MFDKIAAMCNYKSAMAVRNKGGKLVQYVDPGARHSGYVANTKYENKKHRAVTYIEQTRVMQNIINWFEELDRHNVPNWICPIQRHVVNSYEGMHQEMYKYLSDIGVDQDTIGTLRGRKGNDLIIAIRRDQTLRSMSVEKQRHLSKILGSTKKVDMPYYIRDVLGAAPDLTYSNNLIEKLLIGPEANYKCVFDMASRAKKTFDIIDYEWDADSHMARLIVHGILSNIAERVFEKKNRKGSGQGGKGGPLKVRMICDYACAGTTNACIDVLAQAKYSQIAESCTWIIEQTLRMIEQANNGTTLDDVLRIQAKVWQHVTFDSNHSKYHIRDCSELVITGNNVACVYNMSVDPIKINKSYSNFLKSQGGKGLKDNLLTIKCDPNPDEYDNNCAATTVDVFRGTEQGFTKDGTAYKAEQHKKNGRPGWEQRCSQQGNCADSDFGISTNYTEPNYLHWFDFGVHLTGPAAFAQSVAADENWGGGEIDGTGNMSQQTQIFDQHQGFRHIHRYGKLASTSAYGGQDPPAIFGDEDAYLYMLKDMKRNPRFAEDKTTEVLIVTKNPQKAGIKREGWHDTPPTDPSQGRIW